MRCLPSSVFPLVVGATVIVMGWLGWASMRDPEALWAPGDLSRYHADVRKCSRCHEPFRGVTTAKCSACHSAKEFAARTNQAVRDFHLEVIRKAEPCLTCHTEHRGALAQITTGAMSNPHGEFIFRATGTRSCAACHAFTVGLAGRPTLLDNATVRDLIEEGEGAHRPGKFADCLRCHVGGRLEIEEAEEKED